MMCGAVGCSVKSNPTCKCGNNSAFFIVSTNDFCYNNFGYLVLKQIPYMVLRSSFQSFGFLYKKQQFRIDKEI